MSFSQRDYTSTSHLILESVRGYRQWKWKNNGLVSMRDTYWTKGLLSSECKKYHYSDNQGDDHLSPDSECTCGFYAHYLPLESYYKGHNNVFGVIEASGKILMGTKGFRAEKARIVALAALGGCNEWFEASRTNTLEEERAVVDFCSSLGVPYFNTVEKMVLEFPQVDLSSLGVPSLDTLRVERNRDKLEYERKAREQLQRVEKERLAEKELISRYGELILTKEQSKRFIKTYKHLGGTL